MGRIDLDPGDLPSNSADTYYPMELIRAATLSWLFSGCTATRPLCTVTTFGTALDLTAAELSIETFPTR